ncbi:hypothetical protein F2Q69_00060250 [Brassica cretica]|uniref:Uncharacterized protein n=1 Tax=Brassica cretica TaxID=69181 RepID=A0A8S9REB3_BRACR|nr:hypothetical protein F2Q69_00060250 [Brassica cretica]
MEFYGGAGRSILGDTGTVIKSDNKFFNRRIRTRFPDSRNIPRLDRRLVICARTVLVEAKLQELKDKIGSGSTHEIKDAMAALNQEMMQIGQSMYNQPGLEQRQELQVLPLEVKVIHHQEKVLMM